jgi:hypothetical protein
MSSLGIPHTLARLPGRTDPDSMRRAVARVNGCNGWVSSVGGRRSLAPARRLHSPRGCSSRRRGRRVALAVIVAPQGTMSTTTAVTTRGPGPWLLPARLRRRGEALLHQQCWCWGQDIRRAEGNLLLQRGFSRTRQPHGAAGGTRYSLTLAPGRRVSLWGWGLMAADLDLGTLLLGRYAFVPRYSRDWRAGRDAHAPGDVEGLAMAWGGDDWRAAGALLTVALEWTASYEAWVTAVAGAPYRDGVLTAWGHGRDRAATLPGAWRRRGRAGEAAAARGLSRASARPAVDSLATGDVLPAVARRSS